MLTWEEIMQKSPTLKKLVEDKITEEVHKKQVEIDALKLENDQLQTDQIATLEAIAELYEMTLGGM